MSSAAMHEPTSAPESKAWRRRLASPTLALTLGGFMVLLLAAAVPLSVLAHQFSFASLTPMLLMVPFAAVGVLVAHRQPTNPIGWIQLGLALSLTIGADAGFYSIAAFQLGHRGLPLARLAVVLATGWIALILLLPLPVLLFPDGRLPSRAWRRTLWVYLAVCSVFVVAVGVADTAAFTDRQIKVDSSGELASLGSPSGGTLAAVLFLVYALISLSWVVRQVVGYRRSTGARRQQMKCLMTGGAICIVGFVASAVAGSHRSPMLQVVSTAGYVALAALPLGIGVGILRYRLYEIDRLISRTVSYAVVTALLVGVFLGVVSLTTDLLPFSSPIGVAASTLAAAALFNPLRRRVQRIVDRRFNRTRYDAESTVAAFTARVRDAVDLETIQAGLLDVVNQAVEPSHVTMWIRSRV